MAHKIQISFFLVDKIQVVVPKETFSFKVFKKIC